MNRRIVILMLVAISALTSSAQSLPTVFAHRGCWLQDEVPENSVAAVEMAKRFGYKVIECDVHYTKDSVMAIMHDFNDMRRCIRKREGYAPLTERLSLSEIDYSDLRRDYVLPSTDTSLRTPIPTLEELLLACRENGITPMLHSDIPASYVVAQRIMGDDWIAFCGSAETLKQARKISSCLILLDLSNYPEDSRVLDELAAIGGRCGVSTMDYYRLTPAFCRQLRRQGYEVQASIYPTPFDIVGTQNGVSIQLSDFLYLPTLGGKPTQVKTYKKMRLHGGEKFVKEAAGIVHYGAQTMDLTFRGDLTITLPDGRRYMLHHDKMKRADLGVRFINRRPDIRISAGDETFIKRLTVTDYVF